MPDQDGLDSRYRIYSTCPQSRSHAAADYRRRIAEVAAWSEEAGCTGILVYADNGVVDPWLVAQTILQGTRRLCPLVAVQPIYMHPYTVAKMVASLAWLHDRRVCLNMIAGGFTGDLQALGDPTPHDERYARLAEYTTIIRRLLEGGQPVSFDGRHYTVRNLRLTPALPPALMPAILMSGSSEAGMAAAESTGAVGIVYPQPVAEQPAAGPSGAGIRLGILARPDAAEAWAIAHARFPDDDRGRMTHKLAMAVSDSVWHRQLSAQPAPAGATPYWLWPFQTYKTFCPYLVGSIDEVAAEVAAYLAKGYRTVILDVPQSPEDLDCARQVFARAAAIAAGNQQHKASA